MPSSGDTVSLVDVQAGMSDAATATTNADGQYTLAAPGMGPYLIRVSHQGATYFIAAPQSGSSGDVTVYDVAAKLDGVGIDADMLLIEAGGGVLRIHERYLVRNTSLPPRAQFSSNTFEIAIPPEAILDGASATRPGGLGTNTHLVPLSEKGHYTFNVPIQPDKGEKETLFEVQYHLSYSGRYTLAPHLLMHADNLVIYVANGMTFSDAQGANFQPAQEDPRVQTFRARNVQPGQAIRFAVSGEGQMASNSLDNSAGQPAGMSAAESRSQVTGSAEPQDRGSATMWWILGVLAAALILYGFYLRRKRIHGSAVALPAKQEPAFEAPALSEHERRSTQPKPVHSRPAGDESVLLSTIKEELFAIESEKVMGTLSQSEYADIKAGLEAVLKRELKKRG
jgi:hypothetical protein